MILAGRQLDGERHPVELAADLDAMSQCLRCERERAIRPLGSVGEEPNSIRLLRTLCVVLICRHWERLQRPGGFAGETQRLPARRDYPYVRAAAEQRVHECRGCHDQVLAVVEDDQSRAIAQRLVNRGCHRPVHLFLDLHGDGELLGDQVDLDDGAEIDEPDTIGETVGESGSDLE